jgi:N-carbamoylputrescine amidase
MKNLKANNVRIGLVQMASGGDLNANLKKALTQTKLAAAEGARIVCLQELYRSPYFCRTQDTRNFDLAERIPGPSTDAFSKMAKQTKTVVILSLFEKRSGGVYHNTAVVIDADGKILGKYRKMHIPDDPGFNEKFYFIPGDLGFQVFKTRYADIGVLICWDQWFPEAARLTALAGAEILFYPTAIGWKPTEPEETRNYHSAWETIQRSHAIANGVYVAATNRVGHEGDLQFWGQSFVSDPFGHLIYRASSHKEEIILADCDLSKVEKTRREWPFFRDRRVDAYEKILTRSVGSEFGVQSSEKQVRSSEFGVRKSQKKNRAK